MFSLIFQCPLPITQEEYSFHYIMWSNFMCLCPWGCIPKVHCWTVLSNNLAGLILHQLEFLVQWFSNFLVLGPLYSLKNYYRLQGNFSRIYGLYPVGMLANFNSCLFRGAGKNLWFVAFINFCGISTPTITHFKQPMVLIIDSQNFWKFNWVVQVGSTISLVISTNIYHIWN